MNVVFEYSSLLRIKT